jgi:hypothetical protein
MKTINREYLSDQLEELSNWADYLHQSLTLDRPFERGKLGLLESLVPKEELNQLRNDLRSIQYRLSNLSAQFKTISNLRGASSASEQAVSAGRLGPEAGGQE